MTRTRCTSVSRALLTGLSPYPVRGNPRHVPAVPIASAVRKCTAIFGRKTRRLLANRLPGIVRVAISGQAIFSLCAFLFSCLVSGAAAAQDGVAVFGSFRDANLALDESRDIATRSGVITRVESAMVSGRLFHRVVSERTSEADARKLVSLARRDGIDAWFQSRGDTTGAMSQTDAALANRFGVATVAGEREAGFASGSFQVRDRERPPARSPARLTVSPPQATTRTAPPAIATARPAVRSQTSPTPSKAGYHPIRLGRTASAANSPASKPSGTPDANGAAVSAQPSITAPPAILDIPYHASAEVHIDGKLDEAVWTATPAYQNMRVTEPDTLEAPEFATHVRLFFTDEGLYVSGVMTQPPASFVERLSSRDETLNRDSFGIALDSSGDGLYGYWFTIGLGGSVEDGRVLPERNLTSQWDGPWVGATAKHDDGWSAEMFLPWSMMSMPQREETRSMGIWVNRKVAHADESYGWPALPFAAAKFMSALQPIQFDGVKPVRQWAAYPFISNTYDDVNVTNESRIGLDIFARPSSNLQVTATINPDFGAVESDDVVVNLSAFETYFPEKRLFFLEGTEVFITSPRSVLQSFSSNGTGGRQPPQLYNLEPTTLLNTRRIGGAAIHAVIPDGVSVRGVELSKPTDLFAAAKVVGQSGGVRYGVMGAFEQDAEFDGLDDVTGLRREVTADGRNFGVARVVYDARGAGRKSVGYMTTLVDRPDYKAVVHGIDTHYLSASGKLSWDTQYVYSDVERTEGFGAFTDINYTPKTGHRHSLRLDYFDDSLDISDMGFLRRNDSVSLRYSFMRNTSRGLPSFARSAFGGVFVAGEANTDGFLTRGGTFIWGSLVFNDNSQLTAEIDWFTPSWDDRNSRGNGKFKIDDSLFSFVSYGTDSARPFSLSIQSGYQEETLGGNTWFTDVGFTFKPNHRLSIDLDLRYKKRDDWLIHMGDRNFTTFDGIDLGPRLAVDFFLSAKQQLRLTMQWAGIEAAEQTFWQVPIGDGKLIPRMKDPASGADDFTLSRLTTQFRYRWEIGPLSDLFVVYTRGSNLDNRSREDFEDLFRDALDERVVDLFIIKLRYRFGS
jgi:hypothetical protein